MGWMLATCGGRSSTWMEDGTDGLGKRLMADATAEGRVVGARGVIVVLLVWAEKNDHGDGWGGAGSDGLIVGLLAGFGRLMDAGGGRRDEMGFNKGVGSWAADDAGDAGSGVGAGKRRLDACVELLDLGRLMLVDRRWAARWWMEGSWVVENGGRLLGKMEYRCMVLRQGMAIWCSLKYGGFVVYLQ
ncbi:hypothetical protein ACLOJK_004962 [Asimina triloba]